ncbi:hypothetical protein [Massilia sp. TS11]|uniref:hypothetical protein n=1 Tax=Massilia sp. TS11 TaxID=2908003 RepID=UPI001EDC1186|nr:hypothetical protein [Massilia sp. TS11]MCG2585040.1 hypothetical protein [Massilia sp. TS11]
MKKFAAAAVLIVLACVIWSAMTGDMTVNIDGDEIGGPLGALIALCAGGAGIVIAGVVLVGVGLMLAFLFAGLGLLAMFGLAVGALALAAALSPLLLPALIPAAIVYFIMRKNRKDKEVAAAAI